MNIYLMRHGLTDWNLARRMQGRSDIPLNETGLEQARAVGEGMKDLPLDYIAASPLIRTQQTAQAVAAYHDLPVHQEARLIEMGFGDLEGAVITEHPLCRRIFDDPCGYVPLGNGETYEDMQHRAQLVLDELIRPLEQQGYHDVLLVSHGAVIRAVVAILSGLALADFWRNPPQKNCSVTVLECTHGVISLVEEGRIYEKAPAAR